VSSRAHCDFLVQYLTLYIDTLPDLTKLSQLRYDAIPLDLPNLKRDTKAMTGSEPTRVDAIVGNDEELVKKGEEIVRYFEYRLGNLLIVS
jgi:tRNA G37 N-methylase Trm5